MTSSAHKVFTFSNLCIFLGLLILSRNLINLEKTYYQTLSQLSHRKFLEPGYEFVNFKSFLKGVKEVGFVTDKDMSPEKNDGQFLMAQHALAPIILDLNNPNHEFIIIDSTSLIVALDMNQRLNAHFIQVNEFSKILAQRK